MCGLTILKPYLAHGYTISETLVFNAISVSRHRSYREKCIGYPRISTLCTWEKVSAKTVAPARHGSDTRATRGAYTICISLHCK